MAFAARHKDQNYANNHTALAYSVADKTAREALVTVAADKGKLCLQEDIDLTYILTDGANGVWQPSGGPGIEIIYHSSSTLTIDPDIHAGRMIIGTLGVIDYTIDPDDFNEGQWVRFGVLDGKKNNRVNVPSGDFLNETDGIIKLLQNPSDFVTVMAINNADTGSVTGFQAYGSFIQE